MDRLIELINEKYSSDVTKKIYINFITNLAKHYAPKKAKTINWLYNSKNIVNYLINNYDPKGLKIKLGYIIGILSKTEEIAETPTALKKHKTALNQYRKELDLLNLSFAKQGKFELTKDKKYPLALFKKRQKQ